MRKFLKCYIYIFYYIIFKLTRIQSKSVIIKSDENYIYLKDIIKNNQNDNNNELILEFVDDYYDMLKYSDFKIFNTEISVQSSIIFKGNSNGTIFDYKNDYFGNIHMSYEEKNKMLVKFENIIFKNYNPSSQYRVGFVNVITHTNDFQLQFINCTFVDVVVNSLVVHLDPGKLFQVDPQIVYNNCKF